MMRIASLIAGLTVGVASGLLACNRSPAAPANSTLRVLEIVGPSSVAPGETRQFTAIVRSSDGSSRDATTEVTWESPSQVFSVSSTGLVSGVVSGDGELVAIYRPQNSLTATKEVIVVPAQTYRLAGLVTESDSPSVPIAGARLDVLSGNGAGLFTTTEDDGRYRLYGVGGEGRIRISKGGYDLSVESISIHDHAIENFQLTLSRARMEVGGRYQLTIEAADSCRAELPEEARRRVYTAVLAQQGRELEAVLSDATFATSTGGHGSRFAGTAEPDHVRFTLDQEPFYSYYPYTPWHYPDVVEQLTSGFLIIAGSAVLTRTSRGLSGTLDGTFEVSRRDPRQGRSASSSTWCGSPSHRFVMNR